MIDLLSDAPKLVRDTFLAEHLVLIQETSKSKSQCRTAGMHAVSRASADLRYQFVPSAQFMERVSQLPQARLSTTSGSSESLFQRR